MINQIILSCNEDETYSQFWGPTSHAYRKLFPDVTVHLAFVTNRAESDPLVATMRTHGRVTLFKPIADVPEGHQAKVARFILASQQGAEVCYIDDIDLIPLNKKFITDKTDKRPNNVLLCVGGEVYGLNGCYPISQMTAEGHVWKQFINPRNLSYPDLIRSWKDKARFDDRENINIWPDMVGTRQDYYFSDERLLRRLIFENPVPKLELQRGYDDYLEATIDRHTLDKETDVWNYDVDKLKRGGFVNVHGVRPFKKYLEQYKPIINFINDHHV